MTEMLAIATVLVQHYESCELDPYPDATGIPTIGWGNTTYEDGSKVTLDDDTLTQKQADALFAFELTKFSNSVAPLVPNATPNELAAFVSLAYNIGTVAFSHSTALREYLRGNKDAAASGIEMWNKAGRQVLKGLRRRRRAERYVFQGMDPKIAIAQAEANFP